MKFDESFKSAFCRLDNYNFTTNFDYFFDSYINGIVDNKFIDDIIALRTDAFKIQALGRVLRSCKSSFMIDEGNKLRDSAKFIEDSIGQFLYFFEMFELSIKGTRQQLNGSKSDVIIASLLLFDKTDSIKKHLTVINNSLKLVTKDFKKIRKSYLKGSKKELKKINQKIVEEINPKELEDGTHKLRRLIRWVIMYFTYPQGLFEYDYLPNNKVSSFLVLAPSQLSKPKKVSYELLSTISDFVGDLGSVKDEGLHHHYLQELGGKKVDINHSSKKIVTLTQLIINQIKQDEPILKLRSYL